MARFTGFAPPQGYTGNDLFPSLYGPPQPTVPLEDFNAPLTTSIVPIGRSQGSPTFSRATAASVLDHEGIIRYPISGEARFQGARRVANLVNTKSEDWTNAAWTKTVGTVTATTLTATGANQTCIMATGATGTFNCVMRVRMSRITGTGNIDLTLDGGATWTTVTLTASAQVFSISQSAVATPKAGIRIVTSGDAINADQIQLEDTTGQSVTAPGEYVSVGVLSSPWHGAGVDAIKYFDTTNGNSVASNVVSEASGTPIAATTLLGYPAEGARTNGCPYSEQFNDAGWTKGAGVSVTQDAAVAPDGASTADRFDAAAGAGAKWVYRTAGVVTAKTCTVSVYAKAGTVGWLGLGFGNGASGDGAFFNLSTGAIGTVVAGGTATMLAVGNGWYRCAVTRTLAGPTNCFVMPEIHGADNQAVTWTAAGTETLFVWGAQGEVNNDAFVSSYIPTTAAAVARNADVEANPVSGNLATNDSTIYLEWKPSAAGQGTVFLWGSYVDASNYTAILHDGTNIIFRKRIAGANTDATKALTYAAGTTYKIAARASSVTGQDIFVNGVKGTTQATLTAMQLGTTFQIGCDGNSLQHAFGEYRQERCWTRSLSDSQVAAI